MAKRILLPLLKVLLATCAAIAMLLGLIYYAFMWQPVHENVAAAQERAEKGDLRKQYLFGIEHLTGKDESRTLGMIKKDNKKAVFWLGSAANNGYEKAYAPYAEALLRDGQIAKAAQWRKKAARVEKP